MKIPLCHLLFLLLHHSSLLHANTEVQQIPEQNIVEVSKDMSRILRFRITTEDTSKIIIKYTVNGTTSLHPQQILDLNALYTATVAACISGSTLQCKELQILVQGRSSIHNTSFHIQLFSDSPSGIIQIATAKYFKVQLQQLQDNLPPSTEATTSPTTQTAPTQTAAPALDITTPTAQTTPFCPNSKNTIEDMNMNMNRTSKDIVNFTLFITFGVLTVTFAVSFLINIFLCCKLVRRRKLESKSNNSSKISRTADLTATSV